MRGNRKILEFISHRLGLGNYIGDEGASHLNESLTYNFFLRELLLENEISEPLKQEIYKRINRNVGFNFNAPTRVKILKRKN
jgi:hypothetical protein